MKIKTSDLTGAALDWAVAKCEGVEVKKYRESPRLLLGKGLDKYSPSTDWSQGGPIIERDYIDLDYRPAEAAWSARASLNVSDTEMWGETPLIAAMRCYVASKLGDEVDVPEELL